MTVAIFWYLLKQLSNTGIGISNIKTIVKKISLCVFLILCIVCPITNERDFAVMH